MATEADKISLSQQTRWFGLITVLLVFCIGITLALILYFPQHPILIFILCLAFMLPCALFAIRIQLQPVLSLFRALTNTVASYQDGDYSFNLYWKQRDELLALVSAHNRLGQVLREQRLSLAQRELLLETMMQNASAAMILVSNGGHIVYGNQAASQLLNQSRSLEGYSLESILRSASPALRDALARTGDGLFSVATEHEDEDIYHLARNSFSLNGLQHELIVLRQLTQELRRQEVQTWKKVIRVISHELNNSLGPLASLARSGTELVRRNQTERLPQIFTTIEERIGHLETFVLGYARFAKLPTPQFETCEWKTYVAQLSSQIRFKMAGELPIEPVSFDPAQMTQALLNLLKNAHESGSDPDEVELRIKHVLNTIVIDVMDRGSGLSPAAMPYALIPFYSTKRSGTGLGLALAREIAEAHGGRITLANREAGGLLVSIILPAMPAS